MKTRVNCSKTRSKSLGPAKTLRGSRSKSLGPAKTLRGRGRQANPRSSKTTASTMCKLKYAEIILAEELAMCKSNNSQGRVYTNHLRNASCRGGNSIIKDLLYLGCDLNLCDGSGLNAMHCTAQHGRVGTINLLAKVTDDDQALVNSSGFNDGERHGNVTPLMLAAANGHASAVSKLLKKGANVVSKSTTGKIALHYAASNGRDTVITILVSSDHGRSLNSCDARGRTPLHCAVLHGHRVSAIQLCRAGANLSIPDVAGYTGKEYCSEELWEELMMISRKRRHTTLI